jgi:predicted transposase YbfD/YdcC
LLELLEGLPDPRLDRRKRHKLVDVLTLAICGALCSVDNFVELERFGRAKEKWFRTFLELPNGIPSHDTFGRVLGLLEAWRFRELFIRWAQSLSSELQVKHVAIDGKTLRGSVDRANGRWPLHMVSAWAVDAGLVLGQVKTAEGSNEITAVPELLKLLELKGCLVTVDALHCQKETVKELHEKGAEYVIAVKENQPELRWQIAEYFDEEVLAELKRGKGTYRATKDREHGRVETRRYWLTGDVGWLTDLESWPGVTAIGRVERVREPKQGQASREVTYYLCGLKEVEVKGFARAVRGHWGIENSLHWVLDVAFDEDRNRARMGDAQENFAMMRQVALNLIKQDRTAKVGVKCKRKMCGWDHDYLLHILSGDPTYEPPPRQRGKSGAAK